MITRSYIEYLQYINRKTPKSWMSGYVDLPDDVDLPTFEEWQQRWVVRDCPDGVLGRFWHWVRN